MTFGRREDVKKDETIEMSKPNELRRLQLAQLYILKKVVDVCKSCQINYILHYGTLLGAIRHNGFIPWDDDIDIAMKRTDYDKFLQIAQSELGDDFFVQHYTTDSNYTRYIIKVRLNGTEHIEYEDQHIHMNHGIYLDIFPLDNVLKPNGIDLVLRKRIIKILRQLIATKKGINERDSKSKNLARLLLRPFIYLFPDRIFYSLIETTNKWSSKKGGKFWASFNGAYDIKKEVIHETSLNEISFAEFEGCEFRVPTDFDKVLSTLYGDYMMIPFVENRISHDIIKLDLGKYITIINT